MLATPVGLRLGASSAPLTLSGHLFNPSSCLPVVQEFGLQPHQFVDVLALAGDASGGARGGGAAQERGWRKHAGRACAACCLLNQPRLAPTQLGIAPLRPAVPCPGPKLQTMCRGWRGLVPRRLLRCSRSMEPWTACWSMRRM